SKTINLPSTASWEDIARVYMRAYDTGCKGITIFRDGSKDPALQVGTKDKKEEKKEAEPKVIIKEVPARNQILLRDRPDVITGYTYKVNTDQGHLYLTVNEDETGIFEVFLSISKSGSYTAGYTQAVGRLVSTALRSGIKPDVIIDQLLGIRTSTPTMNKGGMIVYSVPDAVAKMLKKHISDKSKQMELLKETESKMSIQKAQPQVEEVKKEQVEEQVEVVEQVTQPQVIKHEISIDLEEPKVEVQEEVEDPFSKYTKENKHGDILDCPDCAGELEYAEGCVLCRSCGYSKCG
ncbi:hypothetical protein KC909_06580, partial [Candidatus Dojkabacteria bacterium]|nr:hypothetical protein [Candidatus Dojkabacteria bacterium]